MKNRKYSVTVIGVALLMTLFYNGRLWGQEVSMGISSREAWVGSPIILQIRIENATQYKLPSAFEIDGCDVRTAGSPSQASQITIINGRRRESRSVTQQYLITPRRAGTFEIPELEIEVAGDVRTTQTIQFVATKSETGDLLFVEIDGDKDKVYVGEPLKLKLKLWIKPFVDPKQQIKLKESQMWQLISQQTAWGPFAQRLQELADNGQRPGGETVARNDANGQRHEYYLYEVDATVYPNKPGRIDASDLQIVVNYPEALGRSRDPFDSFFGSPSFGGRSPLQGMMGDDFFSSPFGRRLTVSKARPIVAEVSVDSTEVVAVPTNNRPADYRGAVGRYQIIAETETTNVSAGDPISLRIGVVGNGPMELVQAPPLHEIETLTRDFQVSDQSLAGFVQGETKVFVTSIRPRNENVKQIPPIPFTFFNPATEAYETAYTEPISIDVEKAESLDMNSIVSDIDRASSTRSEESLKDPAIIAGRVPQLDLRNDFSLSLTRSREPRSSRWWWFCMLVPPFCWLVAVIARILGAASAGLQPLKSRAIRKITTAQQGTEIVDAIGQFISGRTKCDCPTIQHAVGQLRAHNAYDCAAQLEVLVGKLGAINSDGDAVCSDESLQALRRESLLQLDLIETVFDNGRPQLSNKSSTSNRSSFKDGVTISIIVFTFCCCSSSGLAADELSKEALRTVLIEANAIYQEAQEILNSKPAEAKQMFETSAQRYRLLVEHGIHNDSLFLNLGNAWYQCGDTPKAILNYHRALWVNPDNSVARANLRAIENLRTIDGDTETAAANSLSNGLRHIDQAKKIIADLTALVGYRTIEFVCALTSISFWMLITIKTIRPQSKTLRWCIVPLALAVATGVCCLQVNQSDVSLAVCMEDEIELKRGDGTQFETEATLKSVSGIVVHLLDQRARWQNVRLPDGRVGWVPDAAIEKVAL